MVQKSPNKRKPTEPVEPIEESEDYCFVCKDGGELILCDHEICTKAYHLKCIGEPDVGEKWICDWHTCCKCRKGSSIGCICCPNAVCENCIVDNGEFARLGGVYGICDECLKLAVMVEEGIDVDSDNSNADFNDRETMEGLFKEYWEIMRDKENLTLKDLLTAKAQMEKINTVKSSPKGSHSDDYAPDEDYDEVTQKDKSGSKRGRKKKRNEAAGPVFRYLKDKSGSKKVRQKRKRKAAKGPKKIEFTGWGSKPLIEFLISIGQDTSEKLSQNEVAGIINTYAREKNLFDPAKKKKIICDDALYSLLGRKSMTIYKTRDFLEPHFLENYEYTDEEEHGCSSEDVELKSLLSSKNVQNQNTIKKSCQKKDTKCEKARVDKAKPAVLYSPYASIVPENIKLVYLKRSLVVDLLKNPESCDHKVIGSFVKVKSAARKCHYELLQVTDVNRPDDGNRDDIVLKLSGMDDAPISMLADDDFSEEECEELRHKVEKGILERPTVVNLQQKVDTLHEDITKHAIARELIVLQHRIDLANEKGWRDLFYKYGQTRKLLMTQEEQARRLNTVPRVTADVLEAHAKPEPDSESS